ncbi:MAG: hypothetical protein ACP5NQ_07260 [Vulcanisaeta sp.]
MSAPWVITRIVTKARPWIGVRKRALRLEGPLDGYVGRKIKVEVNNMLVIEGKLGRDHGYFIVSIPKRLIWLNMPSEVTAVVVIEDEEPFAPTM